MRLSTTEQRFKVCSDAIKPYADKLALLNAYFDILTQDTGIEGYEPYPYLDSNGFLTVGIGHQIVDYKKHNWLKGTCDKASASCKEEKSKSLTAEEKKSYFEYIESFSQEQKNLPRAEKWSPYYFRNGAGKYDYSLFLPKLYLEKLFQKDANEKITSLKNKFLHLFYYPKPVQIMLLDFAYNHGVTGLITSSPRFVKAIRKAMQLLVVDKSTDYTQIISDLESAQKNTVDGENVERKKRRKLWLKNIIDALNDLKDKKKCSS